MREIRTFWFTNSTGVIGVVVGEDEVTGERKAYIGTTSGRSERADAEVIKNYGSPVSQAFLQEMIILMQTPEHLLEGVKKGIEALKAGSVRPWEDIKQELNL